MPLVDARTTVDPQLDFIKVHVVESIEILTPATNHPNDTSTANLSRQAAKMAAVPRQRLLDLMKARNSRARQNVAHRADFPFRSGARSSQPHITPMEYEWGIRFFDRGSEAHP